MTTPSAKRKIGGYFGSAVGASTKRKRGDWREEVDEAAEVSTPAAPVNPLDADDSDSDAPLDPGTPLPSEDEEDSKTNGEKHAPSESLVSVNGNANAAATPDDSGASETPDKGNARVAEVANPEPHSSTVQTPQAVSAVPQPVVITLELVLGGSVCGSLRVLLRRGLDGATETRLKACAAPAGATMEAVVRGALCAFGGHVPLPFLSTSNGVKTSQQAGDDGTVASWSAPAESSAQHGSAGILSAPLHGGPGLVLTLGSQPQLDETHRALGPVLAGRRVLRHIAALAPLIGGTNPRQEGVVLRVVGPKQDSTAKNWHGNHPFLLVEPEPAANKSTSDPFSLDEMSELALCTEELEVAELEINGCDAEIAELKPKAFTRERQAGVAAVEAALADLEGRMENLGGLDETLKNQRSWLQERVRHLLRILKKLR